MTRVILIAFALSGCAAGGGFVAPSDMTPQEQCDNAYLVAIGIEGQYGPESPPAARAFVAADGICLQIFECRGLV